MAVDAGQGYTQWDNTKALVTGSLPYLDLKDSTRAAAYLLYEHMYWNMEDAFRLVRRGQEANPVYVPSAKTIVEAAHRYTAPKMTYVPALGTDGASGDINAIDPIFQTLMKRERFYSKFQSNKRFGILRGDWVFHVTADPLRPQGQRISIHVIDPTTFFKDVDVWGRTIAAHVAEPVFDASGKLFVKRLTYRRIFADDGTSTIEVSDAIFKPEYDKWRFVEDSEPEEIIQPPTMLDPRITAIPLYHIINFDEGNSDWGSSELRGMELLASSINQAVSDEDITLALEGLGVYATDAGTPIDEQTRQPVPWNLGPARVVELPGEGKFWRVNGASTMSPYQDHISMLKEFLKEGTGTPDIAIGEVDVQVAESGIALNFKMAPMLSRAEEKESTISDVLTNLSWDLKSWLAVYEGVNTGDVIWLPTYGEKLPVNRKERFAELMAMFEKGVVSRTWLYAEMAKIGYTMGDAAAMLNEIMEEKMALGTIEADVMGSRLDSELGVGSTSVEEASEGSAASDT